MVILFQCVKKDDLADSSLYDPPVTEDPDENVADEEDEVGDAEGREQVVEHTAHVRPEVQYC